MSVITRYNNLDGKVVERTYIKSLITRAKTQKVIVIEKKLTKLLKKYPKANRFDLVVQKKLSENGLNGVVENVLATTALKLVGLAGEQHKGKAKKALDNCGHLKPRDKFKKGGKIEKVVKVKKLQVDKPKKEKKPKPVSKSRKVVTVKKPNTKGKKVAKKKSDKPKRATRQKNDVGLTGDSSPTSDLVKSKENKAKRPRKTKSVNDFMNREFNPVPVKDKWKQLIGDFELPTHILLTGKGGNGKSGMAFEFAQDMTDLGYRVLYASPEQYHSPTLGQLLRDVGIRSDNSLLEISNEFESEDHNPSMFDIVILDSKDSFNISNPKDFEELVKKHPNTSFIAMSQATKEGVFSGSGKWRNVVDVMLEAHERGKMRTGEKNRWNQFGEVTLFEVDTSNITDTPKKTVKTKASNEPVTIFL